ncbi:hypothetical protein G7B40_011390 [Aetokthonos hydrillicola Thurmond2011]|jgi:hypothetical protein|uniref:Uncharacterized protein n=2 Tax=Aetokthonos TaxID=1550243 RepID=A0AAP5I5H1_9CYAN|nr:hypothetical protein [Aetokthonos hydrillicola]MDR9895166.1 hypothetical protein [Aetokthonos hydrillicola Thurmond2011]
MKLDEDNDQEHIVISINHQSIVSFSCLIDGEWESGSWLKLYNVPEYLYFNEAILLCRNNDNIWLAWIPDYGEIQII